jgi:oligopeptidase B
LSAPINLQLIAVILVISVILSGCWTGENDTDVISPPVADQRHKTLSIHSDTRTDEYYWIRDDSRSDPDVLQLLQDENAYTQAMMAHTSGLQQKLFDEISARLSSSDKTVPVRTGSYVYFREYRQGGEYPLYLRAPIVSVDSESVILDANSLSEGHEFYELGNWSVSPDEKLIAYAEDVVSRREYTVRFKDLATDQLLEDKLLKVSPAMAWAADSETLFYVEKDVETLLPKRVYRHQLGTERKNDIQVYEEQDAAFYTSVYATRSRQFVVISLQSTDSSEILLIPSNYPDNEPELFLPREDKHKYRIRHIDGSFYILTNWQAENYRLMRVEEDEIGNKFHWQEIIPHRADVFLKDVEVFTDHLVVVEQENGLQNIRVIDTRDFSERSIEFPEPAYTVRLHSNPEVDTNLVRYVYSSLTTPESIVEFDMDTGISSLLKQDKVLGEFDREKYTSKRLIFEARDGVSVPISLVYRTNSYKEGSNPAYLYAYGSYGYSTDASFLSKRLSLLDRGFVYAIIHVRGGDELGHKWYEDGKLLNKKNTFNDFVDGTRFLVEQDYIAGDNVFASGGSAGGLLMGVIANEAPELYKGIIADVPFVDVITTMLDESIPLTSGEFSEWGDPRDKAFYQYMLSYSPYDQVTAQNYPNMLVTTGLYDSQVQYFEPVKWVSRLRKRKLDNHLLLIDINMDTGHGGSSGRYKRHRLDALEYAFVLDLSDKQ